MAAALFSSILQLLDTNRPVGDVANEVQVLRHHLQAIIALLGKAEKKKTTASAFRDWIDDEVTDAAYDLVDVLDEWIPTLRISGVGKTSNKVGSFVTRCFRAGQDVTPRDLAFKLETISNSLQFNVMRNDSLVLHVRSVMQQGRLDRRSTLFVDVSKLIGRDEIKRDIVSSLLYGSTEDESELLKTISVVGMGRLGKTAIAQLVYHDEEVKQHFDNRIWVRVSDVFNEINIARAIIAELEHVAVDSLVSFRLVTLHRRIRRSIKGKKFFLVLDDVWADDKQLWEGLIETFKHGAPGSRILLTTRKDTVANFIKDSPVFHLEPLSDEHCWMVVSQTAFLRKGVEECRNLEDNGRRISNKCKGLPLVAKTLGGQLRFKSSREEWEEILNNKIWNSEILAETIFGNLLLSYNDLPLPIRECFRYCAIFPKDFVYDGETIIYHWMAQGYLGLNNDEDLELKGREYIRYLAARSFFQDFLLDTDGLRSTWKMHDIMHDFAEYLMFNDGIVIEVNPACNSMIDLSSRKPRYLTACIPEGHCLPTSIYGAEKLRSLMIISEENAITNEAVRIIFNQAKRLWLVDFGCHNALVDTIPKEIGNLIHLRHINLSGNGKIKGLPGSLCELHNLQYLNLDNCESLENLPNEIGNLNNLIYLRTLHCYRLACYPKSTRRLTNLRQLCGIVLRADRNDPKEFALGDLEILNNLRELSMVLKGNTVDDRELKRAKFENKTHLKEIKLE